MGTADRYTSCMRLRRRTILWLTSTSIIVLMAFASSIGIVRASVTLTDFRAEEQADGSVRVTWTTATELSTIAFQLFRAQASNGPWGDPIDQQAAKGDGVSGGTYTYDDTSVASGQRYYYLLKEIASSGGGQTFAPVSIDVGVTPTTTATTTQTTTASPTVTRTPTRTPTRTQTSMPSGPSAPTATRQYTNTPRPTATALPATATLLPGAPSATPTPVITPLLSTPTTAPGLLSVLPPTIPPTQSAPSEEPAIPAIPATTTPLPSPVSPSPAPSSDVLRPTTTPPIFAPSTSSVLPAVVTGPRPTATPAIPSSGGSAADRQRMILIGVAVIAAGAVLAVVAVIVWRSKKGK